MTSDEQDLLLQITALATLARDRKQYAVSALLCAAGIGITAGEDVAWALALATRPVMDAYQQQPPTTEQTP